ncbi:hypothetical protein WG908_08800 [Sphingobium sp. AN641]|uniref:hypothetical protein n=1 Tax=Sphingobium sp. AN641 TaxID=3133443 RepID=UPI0030C140DF
MRPAARTAFAIMISAAGLMLSACGSGPKDGNSVQMKDLEVVDGTATDAMTDLDGVQSEGTSIALPDNNGAVPTNETKAPDAGQAPVVGNDEVLADQ